MFKEFLDTHLGPGKNKLVESILSAPKDETEASDDSDREEESEEKNETTKVELLKNMSDRGFMDLLKSNKSDKPEMSASKPTGEKKIGNKQFFTVKLHGLGYNHKKKDVKAFFKPLVPKSIRVPPKIKGIAYVGFANERQMKLALNKNKSFLGEWRL